MSWICPKCERELKGPNASHYCEKISLESLFKGKSDELFLAFDELLNEISQWKNVLISTTPHCVVFVHHKTFFVIRPMKKQLDIKFYSETEHVELYIAKSVFYQGKFENHIRINSIDDLNIQIFKLIKTSYNLL